MEVLALALTFRCALARICTAFRRRLLSFFRRETRRWALASGFSAVRYWRGFSTISPAAVMRNTFKPTSTPVSIAGDRERFDGHLGARDTDIPPVGLADNGDRLWRAHEWAMESDGDTPNLRDAEDLAVQRGTAVRADLRIGERVIAFPCPGSVGIQGSPALTRRKKAANVLSRRCSTSCKTCALISRYSGRTSFDGGQLRRLHGEGHRHTTPLVRLFPLLEASVVEFATAPQDRLQRLFLHRRWHQLVLVGFARAVAVQVHAHLFCLTSEKPASLWTLVARIATRLHPPV